MRLMLNGRPRRTRRSRLKQVRFTGRIYEDAEWRLNCVAPVRRIPWDKLKFVTYGLATVEEDLSDLESAAIVHAELARHIKYSAGGAHCLRCGARANIRWEIRCTCGKHNPIIRVRLYNAVGYYKPQLEEFIATFLSDYPDEAVRKLAVERLSRQ